MHSQYISLALSLSFSVRTYVCMYVCMYVRTYACLEDLLVASDTAERGVK